LSHDEIAERFGCHRNTARAIVHRLELAGLIQIDKEAKRGGYIYRRGNCEARNRAG
jgi:predicted transcriptional regulator